jgi:hypothetical protein
MQDDDERRGKLRPPVQGIAAFPGFGLDVFRPGEKELWARLHGNRWTSGVWCPRKTINNDSRAGRQTAKQEKCCAR